MAKIGGSRVRLSRRRRRVRSKFDANLMINESKPDDSRSVVIAFGFGLVQIIGAINNQPRPPNRQGVPTGA